MAKLLKHFGWGVKKSGHQISSGRSDSNNSTQKSNSVHELMPKSPSRYQSNVCLTSGNVAAIGNSGGSNSGAPVSTCTITSTRSEYDTRSLKLNLDGSKQHQNEKHQYQSLQKGSSSSSRASKGKCDGFISPSSSSNVGSILDPLESPDGTSSSDSAIMPMIADEYCDPLDLAETSSLLVDDDYSIPYDEVNKVLKDIQTNKAERLLNGISSNIIPVNMVDSTDGEHLAKVPLKLTSSSQVTSLRIKPRKPKERKEPVEVDGSEENATESKSREDENVDRTVDKVHSNKGISVLLQKNPSTSREILPSETTDCRADNDNEITTGHLYSSNSTSGGSVTVMSTNNFNDFEPIDCRHMLSSLSVSNSKDLEFGLTLQVETTGVGEMSTSPEVPIKSDRSCQTSRAKCETRLENESLQERDLIRPHNPSKIRPKSDGILLFSPNGSKKPRHKHVQNGKKVDNKSVKGCDCRHENPSVCRHLDAGRCYQGNRTLKKDYNSKDDDLCSPLKPFMKTCPNLPLKQQSWFHGQMGRTDAEKLLEGRTEGSFLVRISESNNEDFSLSLKSSVGFLHIKIVRQAIENGAGKFILGQFSQPFESVASMVQFYRENKLPVKGSESLFLTSPLTIRAS